MSDNYLRPNARLSLGHWLRAVNQPKAYAAELREKYGGLVILEQGGQTWAVVLSADRARQVLSADPAGYDAFWKVGFTGIAGPGSLWVLGGEQHRRERLLLGPAFQAHHFRVYGAAIQAITCRHLAAWQPGQTIRAIETTLAISLDVIMGLVFGVDAGELAREGRRVLKALWRSMHPLFVFFPQLQRGWFPLWRGYARAKADFSDWVSRVLAARRARGSGGDVLSRMLAARYDDGQPMSDAAVRDELLTLLGAGHETTATALAWALYELGRHPAELARLRAELDGVVAAADPSVIVTLPYLSAVCNETLRLHTLLAEIGRGVSAPVALGGGFMPPGSAIIVLVMGIHHDPALYPEPDQFRPERFLGRTYSPAEFLPFGGGHRRCLGAGLSDYEMRLALAEVVRQWDFEPAAVEQDVRHDIAMGCKYGVPLRLLARRAPAAI